MSFSTEWELSKENIMPINVGQKPNVFHSPLSVYPENHLSQKWQTFKQELRVYNGNDPLSVWCDYIKWAEYNYIKYGKKESINKVYEQCLSVFMDEEKYQNDNRFIDIWLKFAKLSSESSKIYFKMYCKNIGCKMARFFIIWAKEMEQLGNLNRSSEILLKGIHHKAQPLDDLRMAYDKLKVGRIQMSTGSLSDSPGKESEQYSICTLLKTQKKNEVPIARVEPMALPASQENLAVNCSQPQPKQQQQTKISFKIFHVENMLQSPTSGNKALALNTRSTKKNKERSKWTKEKAQSSTKSIRPGVTEFIPSEHSPQLTSVKSSSTPQYVLTQREKSVNSPLLFLPESPNPKVCPMYDKMKVYCGAVEYSFEEIRAVQWFTKQKRLEKGNKSLKDEIEKEEMKKQLDYLQKRLFELESWVIYSQSNGSVMNAQSEFSVAAKKSAEVAAIIHSPSLIQPPQNDLTTPAIVSNLCGISNEKTPLLRDNTSQQVLENSKENSTKSSFSSISSRIKNTPTEGQNHQSPFIESLVRSEVNNKSLVLEQEVFTCAKPIETYSSNCDPFCNKVTSGFLNELTTPITCKKNFYDKSQIFLRMKMGSEIQLGDITCFVKSQFASGAYAKIYAAVGINYGMANSKEERFALKVCKNVNEWEFYICSELNQRLSSKANPIDVSDSVMSVKSAIRFQKNLVLVSKLSEYGTLLDIVNLYKLQSAQVPECVALYFTLELLLIVSRIHECSIIHCDIKPDNILINGIQENLLDNLCKGKASCLQLIDFGRAIDLTFFKPGIVFNTKMRASSQCSEMKEGRPWVFQIDWFGVMGCVHVLLFSEYMSVRKNCSGEYELKLKFRRYWQVHIWQPLFQTFLNIPSCYSEPDVKPFVTAITEVLQKQHCDFIKQMKQLSSNLRAKS